MNGTIHIIGAGLAGLAAATGLVEQGRRVALYEAARMAGGRCRSYYDAALGLTIDNGSHLLLSCNHAAMAYLNRIGAHDALIGPDVCLFDFYDLRSDISWRLAPNDGRLPWWIFSKTRRIPQSRARDYLAGGRLFFANHAATVAQVLPQEGVVWERLWRPVLVSALNTDLEEASAKLAAAIMRESLGAGGRNACPRVAKHGLGPAFVDPAIAYLEKRGAALHFGARLRAMDLTNDRVASLNFGEEQIALASGDSVIFAAPAWVCQEIAPQIPAPTEHRAILNAHFAHAPPQGLPLLTGVVGGLTEWLFAYPDHLSVTISAADRLMEEGRNDLGEILWREIQTIAHLEQTPVPPFRIVKEKRATFAATPQQDARRPQARTRWRNLFLAGDWTQTDLPSTIEGAIRSGARAAALV